MAAPRRSDELDRTHRAELEAITAPLEDTFTEGEPNDNGPEEIAWAYMDAIRHQEIARALHLWNAVGNPDAQRIEQMRRDAQETVNAYGEDLERMSAFTEWYREDSYAVARVASPKDSHDTRSLYIIVSQSPDGWGVVDINDIQSHEPLRGKLDHLLDR
jgi:hypothetical protein